MKSVEWKADPLYVLKAEFESIAANVFLHGFNVATGVRLENLSQRIEEQALWREGDRTGHVRLERRTPRPDGVKLTLRFDKPTQLSDEESKEVHRILDDATKEIEGLLNQRIGSSSK